MGATAMVTNDGMTLTWEEVEPVARCTFSIWVDHPELQWAKRMWQTIMAAGLASYTNEPERTLVAMRFMALCDFYLDFCCQVADLDCSSDYLDWCEALNLSPLRIGQFLALDRDLADEDSHSRALEQAIGALSCQQRELVVETLEKANGGTSGLFLSLWRSQWPLHETGEGTEGDSWDDDEEVLNYVTAEKGKVFQWLAEGAYPCRS